MTFWAKRTIQMITYGTIQMDQQKTKMTSNQQRYGSEDRKEQRKGKQRAVTERITKGKQPVLA